MDQKLAHGLITAALESADAQGIQVSLAVVDSSGLLAAFLRMTEAPFLTIELAKNKAYTSASSRRASVDYQEMLRDKPDTIATLSGAMGGRLALAPGAEPIYVDGQFLGAIGVSGATREQDIAVVTHALATVGATSTP